MNTANIEQTNLLSYVYDFARKTKPRNPAQKELRAEVLDSMTSLIEGREMVLTAFKSGIFQVFKEPQEGTGANEMLKILTPNQMLKRL